ncbi:MAG: UDP-3-O-[3-hydroxymyristoyl] N-acetylglucosamine deacetylase [Geminicoccaceae bacterium]|nr:UDP-3-O-[3-hydroxymyristoyl] N-acetylglucosamine deacetylase [Geminicoccaceae bacterium]
MLRIIDDLTMQRTLRHSIGCVGVGLHTGARSALTLHPAEPDTGIVFRRSDAGGHHAVRANLVNVTDTDLCTALADAQGRPIASIEHLMAALALCGIDNCSVELAGPEVPAMDGSAQPFVFLIECAGTLEQDRPRRAARLERPIEVASSGGLCRLIPAEKRSLHCRVEDDRRPVGIQELALAFEDEGPRHELAAARGHHFTDDLEALEARGLARGVSTKNTLLVEEGTVLNEEGLRFPDEMVRHRMLDAIGDLALLGLRLQARYVGVGAGHALNRKLLRNLLDAAMLPYDPIMALAGGSISPVADEPLMIAGG